MSPFTPLPLTPERKLPWKAIIMIVVIALSIGGYLAYRYIFSPASSRWQSYGAFNQDRQDYEDVLLRPGMRCGDAPFAFPTTGAIFGLWSQSYRPGHIHTGLDIFSGTQPDVTPIYAAYPGFLTRQADWLSTVIIRIPEDPLKPSRQIWNYYTHMADVDGIESFVSDQFPPGTHEEYVEAGTFLGYQGTYSGEPGNPTGLHLHFSVVKDNGSGQFLNELEIRNTYDPSPYFNLAVNHTENADSFPVCEGEITMEDWELVGENE